jgi:hypothetical protein
VTQQQAATESDLRYRLATLINELIKSTGVTISSGDIIVFTFQSATAGDATKAAGTDGSFQFRVTPAGVRSSAYSSGTITASPVNNEQLTMDNGQLKAWTLNGTLYVSGLTEGNVWNVYNLYGQLIYNGIADGNEVKIALPGRGVYVIQSDNQTIKVAY